MDGFLGGPVHFFPDGKLDRSNRFLMVAGRIFTGSFTTRKIPVLSRVIDLFCFDCARCLSFAHSLFRLDISGFPGAPVIHSCCLGNSHDFYNLVNMEFLPGSQRPVRGL
jgi:hypothetical protein